MPTHQDVRSLGLKLSKAHLTVLYKHCLGHGGSSQPTFLGECIVPDAVTIADILNSVSSIFLHGLKTDSSSITLIDE